MTSVLQLEAEVAATRERLQTTIGRIQDKLTVSGMVDEIMSQTGVPKMETSHDFVLGLLRRYPVPVMVAAAGLGYAIYRINRRESARRTIHLESDAPVDVPALNTGKARLYDPDLPPRHPVAEPGDLRRIEA